MQKNQENMTDKERKFVYNGTRKMWIRGTTFKQISMLI